MLAMQVIELKNISITAENKPKEVIYSHDTT